MKVQRIEGIGYQFKCLCGRTHVIHTDKRNHSNAMWQFNGNIQEPTFHPSINYHEERYRDENESIHIPDFRCHFNITTGMIIYHSDSTHEHAGKIYPLPLIKES